MIEQTREIARSFNHTYNCDILVEPEGIYPENEAAGRLPGLDGNAKMSKSLGNGIFLSDDEDTVRKKCHEHVYGSKSYSCGRSRPN